MEPAFFNPVYILTLLGGPEVWAALSLVLLLVYFMIRNRKYKHNVLLKRFLLVLIPSLAIVLLATLFLKTTFPVARPCMPCTMIQEVCNPYCPVNDPSFPSAHAATAFVAFTSVWLVQRRGWQLPVFIIAALVACSRVVLGVHTWLDVFLGSLIGLFVTLIVWYKLKERGIYAGNQHAVRHR